MGNDIVHSIQGCIAVHKRERSKINDLTRR